MALRLLRAFVVFALPVEILPCGTKWLRVPSEPCLPGISPVDFYPPDLELGILRTYLYSKRTARNESVGAWNCARGSFLLLPIVVG